MCGRFGDFWLDRLVFFAAYVLPLAGIVSSRLFTLAALAYLPLMGYMALTGGLYLLYPPLFFFYEQLVAPFGIVVYRAFTLVFILRVVVLAAIKLIKKQPLGLRFSRAGIGILMLAVVLRYTVAGAELGIGVFIDLVFLCFFAMETGGDTEKFRGFTVSFVFAAIASCVVGVFLKTADADGGRYLATLNDPNYLGFYINIAILTVFLHPAFRRIWIKLPLLAVLYATLIASESITGVICNAFLLMFCMIATAMMGRFKLKYLVILLVFAVVAMQIVFISQVNDWGIVSSASARVHEKVEALLGGNLSGFTTARSSLWRINLEKAICGDFGSILFGGELVSAVSRNSVLFSQTSHEEFIDVFISSGIIGLTAYLVCVVAVICSDVKMIKSADRDSRGLACLRLGIKLVWIFYALGLTMFLNSRFFIPFLI